MFNHTISTKYQRPMDYSSSLINYWKHVKYSPKLIKTSSSFSVHDQYYNYYIRYAAVCHMYSCTILKEKTYLPFVRIFTLKQARCSAKAQNSKNSQKRVILFILIQHNVNVLNTMHTTSMNIETRCGFIPTHKHTGASKWRMQHWFTTQGETLCHWCRANQLGPVALYIKVKVG